MYRTIRQALLAGAFLLSVSLAARGQVKYGVITDSAAITLSHAYNDIEDGYCVTQATVRPMSTNPSDTIIIVKQVVRASFPAADATGIMGPIVCPIGTLSFIHTHPTDSTLNDCNPSRTDWRTFATREWKYEGIVCGRIGDTPIVRFFWREDNPLTRNVSSVPRIVGPALTPAELNLRRDLFLTPLVLASALVRDSDSGGYHDEWLSQDKAFHFSAGFSIAFAGLSMGAPAKWVVPATCAAAAVHEAKQQYHSTKDFAYSCGGAVLAWAWRRVWK